MLIVKWFSQQLYMSLLPSTGQPHNENENTKRGKHKYKKENQMFILLLYIYTEIIFLQAI